MLFSLFYMKGFSMIILTLESFLNSLSFQALVTIPQISTNKWADSRLQKCLVPTNTYSWEETLSLVCSSQTMYWLLCFLCWFDISIWASDIYFMQLWKSNDWYRDLQALSAWALVSMLTWTGRLPLFSLRAWRVPVRVQRARHRAKSSHLPRVPSRT